MRKAIQDAKIYDLDKERQIEACGDERRVVTLIEIFERMNADTFVDNYREKVANLEDKYEFELKQVRMSHMY